MLRVLHRFSDRDLLMRYHWGLGIGHLHCTPTSLKKLDAHEALQWLHEPNDITHSGDNVGHLGDNGVSDLGELEMGNEDLDLDLDGWDDVGSGASDSEDVDGEDFQWDELDQE